jgi:hypothetical protein
MYYSIKLLNILNYQCFQSLSYSRNHLTPLNRAICQAAGRSNVGIKEIATFMGYDVTIEHQLKGMDMSYSERAYFDGDHCQHCADRDEFIRLQRIRSNAIKAVQRERRSRPRLAA